MEKKKTAVQWLIENAKGFHTAESSKAMQEKAIQMELEQIEDGYSDAIDDLVNKSLSSPSDYYRRKYDNTQTFKP